MENSNLKFKKILENQNELFKTLSDNASKILNMYEINDVSEINQEFIESLMEKGKSYWEKLFEFKTTDNFMETIPNAINRTFEFQAELYNQTVNYYKNLWDRYTHTDYQEKMNNVVEIFRNSFENIVDKTNENSELMQESWK